MLSQDAESFAFLCRQVYNMELQYGPDYRLVRLEGKDGPLTQKLSRQELAMRGNYDFRLGANAGLFNTMMRQEQANNLMMLAGQSPIINNDPGKRWEVENFVLQAWNFPAPGQFIGPRGALGQGVAKDAQEENGEMDQMVYGRETPAQVHPNDNDDQHMQDHMAHVQSEAYQAMNQPNLNGHMQHLQQHAQAKQQKQMMQQQQAMMAQQGQGQQGQAPQQQPTANNVAQLQGVGQMGNMGQVPQEQNGTPPANGQAPPNLQGMGM